MQVFITDNPRFMVWQAWSIITTEFTGMHHSVIMSVSVSQKLNKLHGMGTNRRISTTCS